MTVFQENLKRCRENAGYDSAAKFAEAVGIRYPTYVAYENRDREPKYAILSKIANKLNVSTDELLGITRTKINEFAQKCRDAGFSISFNNVPTDDENKPPDERYTTYVELKNESSNTRYTLPLADFMQIMNMVIENYTRDTRSSLIYYMEKALSGYEQADLPQAVADIEKTVKDGITTFDDVYSIAEKYKCSPTDIFKALPENVYVTKARHASMGIKLPSQTAAPPPPATKPNPKRTRKPTNEGNS